MVNKVIIALDMEDPDLGIDLMQTLAKSDKVYGYKVGSIWINNYGFISLKNVFEECPSNQKLILDMQKWGTDPPDFVEKQLKNPVIEECFDEAICMCLGSGSESLKRFIDTCYAIRVTPISVIKMTQPNAEKYLKSNASEECLVDSIELGCRNIVIPATKTPNSEWQTIIKDSRLDINLYATGFKTQGGQAEPMRKFGVTRFILGRAIYEAQDPIKAVEEVYKEINWG